MEHFESTAGRDMDAYSHFVNWEREVKCRPVIVCGECYKECGIVVEHFNDEFEQYYSGCCLDELEVRYGKH